MRSFLLVLSLVFFAAFAKTLPAQRVVHYDLTVTDTIVSFGEKPTRAIAVNGQIPMPTLTFTEGDTAEIVVHNRLAEGTSMHWHGVLLDNKWDGVPYLTQLPIAPGESFTYRFPIVQNGTHWYHSHSGLQEQIGMYGNFVMLKRKDDPTWRSGIDDLPAVPIVLSEWTDLKPENVQRMLRNANDWFAIEKGTTQTYGEALVQGSFAAKAKNEWKRMLSMDLADVYYNSFLLNGAPAQRLSEFKGGDRVRLRVSNGGASSYFWLTYAGGKMTVIANDGNDVEPIEVDRLIVGVSETYDVIVEIPDDGLAYEFLATPEDRTGAASLYLGDGPVQLASRLPKLKYFAGMAMMNDMMNMDGTMDEMGMGMSNQRMDMNAVMYPEITGPAKSRGGMDHGSMKHGSMKHGSMKHGDNATEQPQTTDADGMDHGDMAMDMDMANSSGIVTLNYAMLRSPTPTNLPADAPVRTLRFELTGNMNRYVWSMDYKVLSEVDKIKINKGETVRIIMYNNSMMRHPMHLHGHDFRLLNGQGDYAPLMNVVDIMPMERDTIEFAANIEGDWFFHCHILYHMMAGMNRVLSYEQQAPNPHLPNKAQAYDMLQRESNRLHVMFENDIATNGNDGMLMFQNTRWSIGTEWRLGYHDRHGYETETHLGRYVDRNQWFMPFVGFDWRYRKTPAASEGSPGETNLFGQPNSKDQRAVLSAGFNYVLPMLVTLQGEVFTDGNVRFQLEREDIPLTPRLRAAAMVNTDREYMAGLTYRIARNFALSTHYDSDMGWGVGMRVIY